jgi:hypothetical protein
MSLKIIPKEVFVNPSVGKKRNYFLKLLNLFLIERSNRRSGYHHIISPAVETTATPIRRLKPQQQLRSLPAQADLQQKSPLGGLRICCSEFIRR